LRPSVRAQNQSQGSGDPRKRKLLQHHSFLSQRELSALRSVLRRVKKRKTNEGEKVPDAPTRRRVETGKRADSTTAPSTGNGLSDKSSANAEPRRLDAANVFGRRQYNRKIGALEKSGAFFTFQQKKRFKQNSEIK
jgi:hypothetical protein